MIEYPESRRKREKRKKDTYFPSSFLSSSVYPMERLLCLFIDFFLVNQVGIVGTYLIERSISFFFYSLTS